MRSSHRAPCWGPWRFRPGARRSSVRAVPGPYSTPSPGSRRSRISIAPSPALSRRRLRALLRAPGRLRPLVRLEAATAPPVALDLTAPWYCPSTMKILYFDDFRLGVLEGDGVVDVSHVARDIPHTGPHGLISGLIERFGDYRQRLAAAGRQGRRAPPRRGRVRP